MFITKNVEIVPKQSVYYMLLCTKSRATKNTRSYGGDRPLRLPLDPPLTVGIRHDELKVHRALSSP